MTRKNPYEVVKHRHITEKAKMLQELQNSKSNICVARCELPKYVFIVDRLANKREIAKAIEEIYSENKVKVVAVNTISIHAKARRVRGRMGNKPAFKKAIVTLEKGDSLDNI